jgi:F-type H+-transporting ATPase subunit delta
VSRSREVADVYAEAFFETAFKQRALDTVYEDLLLVKGCFQDSPLLLTRLCMPSLNRNERNAIVMSVFNGKIANLTMRLLNLLIQRGRTELLSSMYDAVMRVRDKHEQIIDVTVACTRPVTAEQKNIFEKKIKTRFGGNSRIVYTTDPTLIAGYRITTPENSLDFSVRSGLDKLRKQLLRC